MINCLSLECAKKFSFKKKYPIFWLFLQSVNRINFFVWDNSFSIYNNLKNLIFFFFFSVNISHVFENYLCCIKICLVKTSTLFFFNVSQCWGKFSKAGLIVFHCINKSYIVDASKIYIC